ncbi:alcohol dehydrogenase catalytic domain-containing protein [Diaminobutyricibacter tongyongensis]|uniref:Alcohol dehydrogenase catalytic domain-containing protein n=1 Tax=Leifsonia tongyongensis TaxID=1268043 RepID=A0A6L9Y2E4_9MICO|nr:zinc-binding dehydrogenase [Diaminobutyricibacter tongyongensis]NEN07840.1 alcohol dehydrogenase catalytic domain-containing protein [Diaminobutyricibacter tongyongensis]
MIALGVRTTNGDIEVLDLPTPRKPTSGELLLQMTAAGIGPWDVLLHTGGWDVGLEPPAALGVEGVGRVIAVGPGVEIFKIGDVVIVHDTPLAAGSGTWAEQVLVHASSVAICPPNLSHDLGAALPVAALTARQALDELRTDSATRLLVVGSGPTAVLAVQLAVQAGASVVAAASPRHADRLRRLGAIDVIDSHMQGWAQTTERRFDAVLVAADGTASEAMSLLEDGGRLCSITSDAPEPARGITSNNLYIHPDGEELGKLAALAAAGKLSLEVSSVTIEQGSATAAIVAAGRSGGVKFVIDFTGVAPSRD